MEVMIKYNTQCYISWSGGSISIRCFHQTRTNASINCILYYHQNNCVHTGVFDKYSDQVTGTTYAEAHQHRVFYRNTTQI